MGEIAELLVPAVRCHRDPDPSIGISPSSCTRPPSGSSGDPPRPRRSSVRHDHDGAPWQQARPGAIGRAWRASWPTTAATSSTCRSPADSRTSATWRLWTPMCRETWRRISAVTDGLARRRQPMLILGGDHGLTFPAVRGAASALPGSIAVIRSTPTTTSGRITVDSRPPGFPIGTCLNDSTAESTHRPRARSGWPGGRTPRSPQGISATRASVSPPAARCTAPASGRSPPRWPSAPLPTRPGRHATSTPLMPRSPLAPMRRQSAGSPATSSWSSSGSSPTPGVVGVDVVEVSPPLDSSGRTTLLGAHVLLTALAGLYAARPVGCRCRLQTQRAGSNSR